MHFSLAFFCLISFYQAPWTQPGYIPYVLNGPINPSNSLLGHQSFAFSNIPSYSNLPFSGSVSGMPIVVGSSAAVPSVHWGPTSFEEKMAISPSNRSSQRISAKEAHLVTSIASTRAEVQKFKAQVRLLFLLGPCFFLTVFVSRGSGIRQ